MRFLQEGSPEPTISERTVLGESGIMENFWKCFGAPEGFWEIGVLWGVLQTVLRDIGGAPGSALEGVPYFPKHPWVLFCPPSGGHEICGFCPP